mmetsp:Transcript_71101/g.197505  ORF Transcript_71101/g.197505 Transcript_71101/m.197505 type:complete len:272 (+) Transcript_71101:102-917(+)
MSSSEENGALSDESEECEAKRYLIGGLPAMQVLAGLVFALSAWRLVDDPSYSFLDAGDFAIVQNLCLPAVVLAIAIFMVVCLINGQMPGSSVVPPGTIKKVAILLAAYVVVGLVAYSVDAFIPFVSASFFRSLASYFLAFVLFASNPQRDPMLSKDVGEAHATSLSYYLFMVPAGFGLFNLVAFRVFTHHLGYSRLTSAKWAAVLGFCITQLAGSKNYPGFSRMEYMCYLAGSLSLYVFTFTGACLWVEEALMAQSASFSRHFDTASAVGM